MNVLPESNTLVRWFRGFTGLKVSDMEELIDASDLSDDDLLLLTDVSEGKSVKIKLSTLKKFIKS